MHNPPLAVMVLDASVIINLLATGIMVEILSAVAKRRVVIDQVHAEVVIDPRKVLRVRDPDVLTPLMRSGVLSRETLSGRALLDYMELVGADPPDDLGDGEAATIAWAASSGAVAVLDDAKAIGLCRRRFVDITVLTTLDLLKLRETRQVLSEAVLHDAVFDALRFARMRVPPEHDAWVRQVVGPERLPLCPSLRRRS